MLLQEAWALGAAQRRADQQKKTEDIQQHGDEKVNLLPKVGELKRIRDLKCRKFKSKKSSASSLVRSTTSKCRDVLDGSQGDQAREGKSNSLICEVNWSPQHGHKQDPFEQIRGSRDMVQGRKEEKASISETSTEKIDPGKPIDASCLEDGFQLDSTDSAEIFGCRVVERLGDVKNTYNLDNRDSSDAVDLIGPAKSLNGSATTCLSNRLEQWKASDSQLAKQLKEALAEKDQLSNVNKTLRSHLNSKDGEMAILKSQMVAAQQVGLTLKEENQSLKKELQQAQSEVTKCKGYLKSKNEEMDILMSQMVAAKCVGHTLKEENQSLMCETTRLKKELQQAQSEVTKYKGYLKSKYDEMDILMSQMVAAQHVGLTLKEENQSLMYRSTRLEKELEQAQSEVTKCKIYLKSKDAEMEILKSQTLDALQIGVTLKEERESFNSRVDRLKKKPHQAKKSKDVEMDILKSQMLAAHQVGVTLKIENESFKSMIENLKKKLKRAKCEAIKCKGYLKSKDGKMDRLKSEMEVAQQVGVTLKEENQSLRCRTTRLEKELEQARSEMIKCRGSLISKDGELYRIKSEMEATQRVSVTLKEENESLKYTVNKLEKEPRPGIVRKVRGSD